MGEIGGGREGSIAGETIDGQDGREADVWDVLRSTVGGCGGRRLLRVAPGPPEVGPGPPSRTPVSRPIMYGREPFDGGERVPFCFHTQTTFVLICFLSSQVFQSVPLALSL